MGSNIHLDKSAKGHTAKKHVCPDCRKRRFVRYFDFSKNEYLDEKYGRCDREEHCGYFEHPFDTLEDANKAEQPSRNWTPPKAVIISVERGVFLSTLTAYNNNSLTKWMSKAFGEAHTIAAIKRFHIGTARNQGTLFWHLDERLRVRTAKRMFYDHNGKRDRSGDPERQTRNIFEIRDGYSPCLYGAHQIWDMPEGTHYIIVESEKTAVISSIYLANIGGERVCWLGAGSVNGLTREKIECLRGQKVTLCPDFSFHARATWGMFPMRKSKNEKGNWIPDKDGELREMESAAERFKAIGVDVGFFDPCPEINDGSDLADYLLTMPVPPYKPDMSPTSVSETSHKELITAPITEIRGNHSFRIESRYNGAAVLTDNDSVRDKVKEVIKIDAVEYLIKMFDIRGGEIKNI